MVRMAKGVVRLHELSDAWRADMARRVRELIVRSWAWRSQPETCSRS
jgi:hypothetical protein